MKRLPEIYKKNNKDIKTNNRNYCYLENIDNNNDKKNIELILKDINIKNKKINIITKDNSYYTYIISITKKYIYTLEDEKISINEIIDIRY